MKDSDTIKLKIIDILRRELTEEEFLLFSSITIRDSDRDKQKIAVDKAVVAELAKIAWDEQVRERKEQIQTLARFVGCENLQDNEFTRDVAKKLEYSGSLSEKQINAVRLNSIEVGCVIKENKSSN